MTNGLKAAPRPQMLTGRTFKFSLSCGSVYITVNYSPEGRPVEVFMLIGVAGGCMTALSTSLSKSVSLALRAGVDLDEMIRKLEHTACTSGSYDGGHRLESCSDALAKALKMAREMGAVAGAAAQTEKEKEGGEEDMEEEAKRVAAEIERLDKERREKGL